jgi:CDP-6-deoxy-D-xylo-4-hexulose-3-dehydrase
VQFELTSSTWGEEEKQAIRDVIESNMFTMGPRVKEFEEKFAKHFGMKYAVMANSGSSANLIAVASLFYKKDNPLERGDEVIVPCISWATTFHPLQQYGLRMKFVDVDLHTLNIDVQELKKAITKKTRMVVAVSILGNPCQFDEISRLCAENNIILFEDNCESMGARFNGRYTGTFGLVNTFSTFSHHTSTWSVALTNDKEPYHLLKSMRNHGWTRGQDEIRSSKPTTISMRPTVHPAGLQCAAWRFHGAIGSGSDSPTVSSGSGGGTRRTSSSLQER